MTILQSLILGIVQGVAEFFPISSSGHLALLQHLWGFPKPPVTFDVLIHVATLLAIVIFFRETIWKLIRETVLAISSGKCKEIPTMVWFIIVGTLPALIVGFLIKDYTDQLFSSISLLGITFLITAAFLIISHFKSKSSNRELSFKNAMIIGLAQAIAILPGVSRSGATVAIGLLRGIKREETFSFSFFLAIPAILGASIVELPKLSHASSAELGVYLFGFFAALIAGLLTLRIFSVLVKKMQLLWFGIYCGILGIVILFFIA